MSAEESRSQGGSKLPGQVVQVSAKPLDGIAAKNGEDAARMAIGGHQVHVQRPATRLLSRMPPPAVFEGQLRVVRWIKAILFFRFLRPNGKFKAIVIAILKRGAEDAASVLRRPGERQFLGATAQQQVIGNYGLLLEGSPSSHSDSGLRRGHFWTCRYRPIWKRTGAT